MIDNMKDAILISCAIAGVVTLGLISDYLKKIVAALERISRRDQ